jgi:hypothetical protein
MVKIDHLKTLESNCNWKNYLADSRFVPPNYLQDGGKPISLFISSPDLAKSISRDENANNANLHKLPDWRSPAPATSEIPGSKYNRAISVLNRRATFFDKFEL